MVMDLTTIVIVIGAVVAIVAVAAVSDRIAVAAPLSLVVVGIALSFLPGLPKIQVDPEWILAGALPPLLYATAVRMPAHDFRRDFKAITGLAVLLVVLTTICSGLLFDTLLPGLGLASALALGAIISPTDAVAATSVGKRLGLPSRLLTILEGEGLVNDASSLVLLSSAVAVVAATVHLWKVGLDFVYAVVVAVAVGLVVGYLNVRVRSMLKDPVLGTAVSFVVPFLAWVPAEELGASGVLAAVVTGLVTGHQGPGLLAARDRLAETVNWETIAFLLESGIFLLMGLQLKTLVDADDAAGLSPVQAVWIGLAAAAVAVVLRMMFVAPLVGALRRDAARAISAKPELEKMQSRVTDPKLLDRFSPRRVEHIGQRVTRLLADIDFLVAESFGWRGGVVLAWSGMRGVVTVAAAQSLPDDIPYRPQLVLIAFVVAATTLLAQGLTLPRVIRILKISGDDAAADRAEYRQLVTDLTATARAVLDDPDLCRPDGSPYPAAVLDRARRDALVHGSSAVPHAAGDTGGDAEEDADPREQYRQLMLQLLAAERARLLSARSAGAYTSRTLTRAQRSMDLMEATLQQIPDLADPGG
jgi:NhaP-type Na+/H+ or K+/H+ antiporter